MSLHCVRSYGLHVMHGERAVVGILGPVTVWAEGSSQRREIAIGGPKPRLLMALLASVGPAGQSDDRLIDAMWTDDNVGVLEADRLTSLRAYVSRLRKVLRPLGADIARNPSGYTLDVGPGLIDMHEFDTEVDNAIADQAEDATASLVIIDRALGRWRGDPFGDATDLPALRAESERLRARKATCRALRVERLLELGMDQAAADAAMEDVHAHPFSEQPAMQLAVALHRLGRQRDANRVLDDLIGRLRDELGMDARPVVRELQSAILDHDPRLDTPQPPMGRQRREPSAIAGPVVGQGTQLQQVRTSAASGRSALVVGPPGCGKSTLVSSIARTVVGSCQDTDQAPAYWPWPAIVDGLIDAAADADLVRPDFEGASSVFEVSLALTALIRAVAPIIRSTVDTVVVEDAHWAGSETLQLHTFLQREQASAAEAERLGLVVTSRPLTEGGNVHELFDVVVEVGLLHQSDVEAMLKARLSAVPDSDTVSAVMSRTGGVPLLVRRAAEELARGVQPSNASPARSSLVRSWVAQASAADLHLARLATIPLGPFDAQSAMTAADSDDLDQTNRSLRRLERLGIIMSPLDGLWTFAHALVRDELRSDLDLTDERAAHLRLAALHRSLHRRSAPDSADHTLHHLRGAGPLADRDEVMAVALAIAGAAQRSGVLKRAEQALFTALEASQRSSIDIEQRVELLTVAAHVTWAAGSTEPARDRFHEASELLEDDDRRLAALAAAAAGFGMTHVEIGTRERRSLHRALKSENAEPADILRCRSRLIIADWESGQITAQADDLVADARQLGDPTALAWALGSRLVSSMTMLGTDQRGRDADEMLYLGRLLHNDSATGLGLAHRADARAALGKIDLASEDIDGLGTLSAATGRPAHFWYHQHYLGALRCAQGRLQDGEERFTTAFNVAGATQGAAALEAFSGALFMARAAAGRHEELLPLLESGDNPAGNERPTGLDAWMLGKAYVLAAVGREAEALPVVRHMADLAHRVPLDRIRSIELAQLILVGQLVKDRQALEAGYELLAPFSHHHCVAPGMISVGSADLFLGIAAHELGRRDEGLARMDAGIANNERAGLLAWAQRGRELREALVSRV